MVRVCSARERSGVASERLRLEASHSTAERAMEFSCPSCGNSIEADPPLADSSQALRCVCCFCSADVEVPQEGERGAKRRRGTAHQVSSAAAQAETPATIASDEPFFLPIPTQDTPPQLHGVINDGLVLRCSGERSSGLYGHSEEVLRMLIGAAEVKEYDDPHWRTLPSIGAALKRIYPTWDECYCVFVCRNAWGVGIANRQRNRRDAGRIALAGAVVAQLMMDNAPPPQGLGSYPAFAAFLRKVRRLVG